MTWFLDTTGFPKVGTATSRTPRSDGVLGKIKPPHTWKSLPPKGDEEKQKFPEYIELAARDDGFQQHILYDQGAGYFFISELALNALKNFQVEGWEALPFPVKPDPHITKEEAAGIVGDTYFLLNLYLHRNIVNLEKGEISQTFINKGRFSEMVVYRPDSKHKEIAINKDLIGDVSIWLGENNVAHKTVFVTDNLKDVWCEMGMNPAIFSPCIDV